MLGRMGKSVNTEVPGKIYPIYFKMTSSEEICQAVMQLKKEQGRVDVPVNNAGMVNNEVLGMISIDKMPC